MYDYEILSDGICTAFTRLDVKKKEIYIKLNKLREPVHNQSKAQHYVLYDILSQRSLDHHRQGKKYLERKPIYLIPKV